jgi:hypothetical protein
MNAGLKKEEIKTTKEYEKTTINNWSSCSGDFSHTASCARNANNGIRWYCHF